MIENLFDFKIENGHKFSVSQNEIYYQFLMYMFFSLNKSLVIVTPSLNEANKIYAALNGKLENVYIFPDDDYLTKKAIATSPELMYMRMRFLNNIKEMKVCCITNQLSKSPKL